MSRPRQVTDERIIEVARQVFLEHGASVSTTVIASRLGISQPALFKRFGTKQGLLIAALRPTFPPPWLQAVMAGPNDEPIRDQLASLAGSMSAFFRELVPRFSVLFGCGMRPQELFDDLPVQPPVVAHQVVAAWFSTAMQRGRIRTTDTRIVARAFIGALHSNAFLEQFASESTPALIVPDYHEHIADLFWQALRPETEETT